MMQETYLQQGRKTFSRLAADPGVRRFASAGAHLAAGLLLSAASLLDAPMPLSAVLAWATGGGQGMLAALGSMAGYWVFWGAAGLQGVVWALGGFLGALMEYHRESVQGSALQCALSSLWVALTGLFFQMLLGDTTPVGVYFLRIALAAAGMKLFCSFRQRQSVAADWLVQGIAVLALSQVCVFPGFSLGFPIAGFFAAAGSLPVCALSGLALELSGVTGLHMTAGLCLAYLLRLLPGQNTRIRCLFPAVSVAAVSVFAGRQEGLTLLGLILGGAAAMFVPMQPEILPRRGEMGAAQVRLEIMAGALSQTQQLLLEGVRAPIDEETILRKVWERACGSCPQRKTCSASDHLSAQLLHGSLSDASGLGIPCRKTGRLVTELRRGQEQLRAVRADRQRQQEYRMALVQQYQFLGDYLRQLSDELPRRVEQIELCYTVQTDIAAWGREEPGGDVCQSFAGIGGRHYVLLCDGMGTGFGACQDAVSAVSQLRQMLSAGFPAEYALRSFNSLCCLRGRAGCVTVDLAEIRLDTGKVTLYKWGAAPSWILRENGSEKVGTVCPPPGLSVSEGRETCDRLSLRRGEVLLLLSDGVAGDISRLREMWEAPLPRITQAVMEQNSGNRGDDATAAAIRLIPRNFGKVR